MRLSFALLPFLFQNLLLILWHAALGTPNDINPSLVLPINGFLTCLKNYSSTSHPISRAIYKQDHPSFQSVLQAYVRNLRFSTPETPKPLAIITASHESHVQGTVICAKVNGLEVRIRSGGHDFEGLSYVSYNPFVILDMFNLRSIKVNLRSRTAWVEAGATLGELYYNIANKSSTLALPGGVGISVGMGGHVTGGGYGTLLRKYGLIVDLIIDAKVVDVRGRILTRKAMGKDLFWAIRGGGASSFCVVVAWKARLVHVPKIVTVFKVDRSLGDGLTDLMYQWQKFAPQTDENLFIRAQFAVPRGKDEHKNKSLRVTFYASFLGSASDLLALIKKGFPLLGLKQEDCIQMIWVETILFFNDLPTDTPLEILLNRIPLMPLTYDKHKSDYIQELIPKAGLEKIWKKMLEVENVTLQWSPYGGRMSEIPASATPFPHRAGNLFKIQYLSYWHEGDPETIKRHIDATQKLYRTFTPYASKNPRRAFLNYRDIDLGTTVNGSIVCSLDYFQENVMRLLKVKAEIDPENFFRNEQSIPVVAM